MNNKERMATDAFEDHDFRTTGSDEFEEHREKRLEDLTRENERYEKDIDPLTELPRRSALEKRFAERTRTEDRRGHSEIPSTLFIADIDDFKRINDTYGHPIGDLVLHATAKYLRDTLRDEDLVVRWGGEEFAGIIEKVTAEDFSKSQRKFGHLMKDVPLVNGTRVDINVTLSAGMITLLRGAKLRESTDEADQLLLKAKAAGKNNIQIKEANTVSEES
jgi:diguanylate cyclase (GGDEF)-like protein